MIFQKCKCEHVSLIKNPSLVSPYSDDKYQISLLDLYDLTPVLFFSVFLHLSPHSLHPSSATLGFFQSLQCILLLTTEDLWIRCSLYLKTPQNPPYYPNLFLLFNLYMSAQIQVSLKYQTASHSLATSSSIPYSLSLQQLCSVSIYMCE